MNTRRAFLLELADLMDKYDILYMIGYDSFIETGFCIESGSPISFAKNSISAKELRQKAEEL